MSNRCPYCDNENFENEATQETETQWINKCRNGCGQYSLYDETLDEQLPLEEPRKTNG